MSVEILSVEGIFGLAVIDSVEFVTAIFSDFSDEVVLRSGIMVDAVAGDVLFGSERSVDTVAGDVLFGSKLSTVDTVTGDVLLGSESLLSVAPDDKGILLCSGFELVSGVAGNGVLSEAFSKFVDVVTTGNVLLFSFSELATPVGSNCVLFSGNLSLAVVAADVLLLTCELLTNELIAGG
ncbi:hypothetical protein [Microcoleus sp. CAWBG58]|uniref:hypothetical protein n=1 Tax=Microcoleus sp. CAWBG58 TaxID=2841651 RepID=UPI0025F3022E|nr:hypothetical protein [Microcoleus sp. CAWBG58]